MLAPVMLTPVRRRIGWAALAAGFLAVPGLLLLATLPGISRADGGMQWHNRGEWQLLCCLWALVAPVLGIVAFRRLLELSPHEGPHDAKLRDVGANLLGAAAGGLLFGVLPAWGLLVKVPLAVAIMLALSSLMRVGRGRAAGPPATTNAASRGD